jgi:hypothetical protein
MNTANEKVWNLTVEQCSSVLQGKAKAADVAACLGRGGEVAWAIVKSTYIPSVSE